MDVEVVEVEGPGGDDAAGSAGGKRKRRGKRLSKAERLARRGGVAAAGGEPTVETEGALRAALRPLLEANRLDQVPPF